MHGEWRELHGFRPRHPHLHYRLSKLQQYDRWALVQLPLPSVLVASRAPNSGRGAASPSDTERGMAPMATSAGGSEDWATVKGDFSNFNRSCGMCVLVSW